VRLRALAMAQPLAAEKLSHGTPVFFVEKGRTFCWFTHDHHGCGITAAIVRTSAPDEAPILIAAEPDRFYRPAYFSADQWVGFRLDVVETDWERLAGRVARSWDRAATPRIRERFGR
jgi:hypothetical protein